MRFKQFLMEKTRTVDDLRASSHWRGKRIIIERVNAEKFYLHLEKSRNGFNVVTLTVIKNRKYNIWTAHSKANRPFIGQGYGPFVYDVVLEYVTNYLQGSIMSATGNHQGYNTIASSNIWKYYYKNRNDIDTLNPMSEQHKKSQELEKQNSLVIEQEADGKVKYVPIKIKDYPWLFVSYQKSLDIIPKLIDQNAFVLVD
jgi:hypothetical protein